MGHKALNSLMLVAVFGAAGCGRSVLDPSPQDSPELRARHLGGSKQGTEPVSASCGNGELNDGEACDGELGLVSCEALGLGRGTVVCHPEACRLDASGCEGATGRCDGSGGCDEPPPCPGMAGCDASPPACGNGVLDAGEQCDGADLGRQTCATFGYSHGGLACSDDCTVDVSRCGYCGDGRRGGPEACDGRDLGELDCGALGLGAGTLRCAADCELDVSQCGQPPLSFCGDGVASFPEQCDGEDLAGRSCESLGLGEGRLRCTRDCALDASGCAQPRFCGDGIVAFPEQCDGGNLGGASCWSLGLGEGILGCTPQCTFDIALCFPAMQFCGDGLVTPPEECDGDDLRGQSCGSLGLGQGQLRCQGCQFDVSGCSGPNPQDCPSCALQRCPDPAINCFNTPGCIQGLTCTLQRCGGPNDLMCVLQCFGGDLASAMAAFPLYQCLQAECVDACGL